jgi:hypothetical protein
MHLMSGRWPGSGPDHPPIQSLEVLRSQTVGPVLTDTGNQMNSDSDPVGVIAALPDRRASDESTTSADDVQSQWTIDSAEFPKSRPDVRNAFLMRSS